MPPNDARLAEELEALKSRVEQLERRVDLVVGAPAPAVAPEMAPPPAALTPAAAPLHPRLAPAIPPRIAGPRPIPMQGWKPDIRTPQAEVRPDAPASELPASASREEPGDEGWGFERRIGGKWYAVAGALIVTIGVALFFKLALDRGWLSFPPAARCLAGAVFGSAMLAAGEWVRLPKNGAYFTVH